MHSHALKRNGDLVFTESIPDTNEQSGIAPLSIQTHFSLNNSDVIPTDVSKCESKDMKSFEKAKHAFRFEMAVPDPQAESSGSNPSLFRQSNQLHVYLQHNNFSSKINYLFEHMNCRHQRLLEMLVSEEESMGYCYISLKQEKEKIIRTCQSTNQLLTKMTENTWNRLVISTNRTIQSSMYIGKIDWYLRLW
jgi:hypothetical protein